MQQTSIKNKFILRETKLSTDIPGDNSLQQHKTLVWIIDITYFQSSHPEYGEIEEKKKRD